MKLKKGIFVLILFYPFLVYGQDQDLVKKYMDALEPAMSNKTMGVSSPSLTMHLEFEYNSAKLTPDATRYLESLAKALQGGSLSRYIYAIQGHTCNLGKKDYNQKLSLKRAESVMAFLSTATGFPKEQFEVEGLGDTKPVVANDTEENRQKNRRVVIINTMKLFNQ